MNSVILKRNCPKITFITKGECITKPTLGSQCNVTIHDVSSQTVDLLWLRKTADASEYLKTTFSGEITIGQGDTAVDRGIEEALSQIWVGQTVKLEIQILPGELKYIVRTQHGKNATSFDVTVTLTLNSVTSVEDLWKWSNDRLLGEAALSKLRGNELFSSKRYVDAFFRYSVAIKYLLLVDRDKLEAVNLADLKFQLATIRNNLACVLHMYENYEEVVHVTSLVIEEISGNVKARLRRAAAYNKLQEYEKAKEDVTFVLSVEKDNKDAWSLMKELFRGSKEADAKLASGMKKLFS